MTHDDVRPTVLDVLADVAPEVDPAAIAGDLALRDQIDLDSMDYLTFLIGLHERLGVEIPERDYDQVATLDGLVAYLERALPEEPASA